MQKLESGAIVAAVMVVALNLGAGAAFAGHALAPLPGLNHVKTIDDWGPYEAIGNQVSVSTCYLGHAKVWTWKFRNDGVTSVTHMVFRFADQGGWHDAAMPRSLKPGGICGGWASFSSVSRPLFEIKEIKRQ